VSRRQAGRWAQQEPQQQDYQEPAYAPPPQPAPPAQESDMDTRLSQLRELGELKDRGLLSDDEFEIQKRHILES